MASELVRLGLIFVAGHVAFVAIAAMIFVIE